MKKLSAKTSKELENLIAEFGNDALFRGQTAHYGDSDKPSVVTSFDRKGCVPSQMLKWSRYSRSVLDTFVREKGDPLGLTQALLQHYGWRSFYIDCSSSAAVGAWFASHSYTENQVIEMSEDCEESPVWLTKRMAHYEFEDGEGNLYILDKETASASGLINLDVIEIDGFRPRMKAQDAWLLGPLRNEPVHPAIFRAHITAPRSVFRDFASERGLATTNDLFPPPNEDPILNSLLGLPWLEIPGVSEDEFTIPAFRRALDIPEYHDSFVKIAWPRTAFFRGARIADHLKTIDGDEVGGIGIQVPDVVLFGTADRRTPMRFPHVERLVAENGTVSFEIDELIQHTPLGHTTLYQKGIGVIPHGPELFELSELLVEHPGQRLSKAGFNKGWFYRRGEDGTWEREPNEGECGCGNPETHIRHVSALHIVEAYLADPKSFDP